MKVVVVTQLGDYENQVHGVYNSTSGVKVAKSMARDLAERLGCTFKEAYEIITEDFDFVKMEIKEVGK